MAYKRHAQGGRFKRGDFGDLGLRAYKDQQDRQIQALKDQNRQEQLYSNQHLQQLQGSGSKEIEHNRMLQGITEDVGKLALQNTKIRGQREVESIEGKAKEAEKQAEFWHNFSTTYANQYAQAATTLYDIHSTQQMHRQMDIVKNHPEYKKAVNNFAHLNNLSSVDQVKAAYNAYFDPKISGKEKSDLIGHLTDLGLRMNHKTKLAVAEKILGDWPAQHSKLKDLAKEKGIKWDEETIGQFYYLRARELLTQMGISHTSKAGQHLLNGIDDIEFDKRDTLIKQGFVARDQKLEFDLKERAQGLVGKMDIAAVKGSTVSAKGALYTEYTTDFNQLIMHKGNMWKSDKAGNPIDPDMTPPNLRADWEVVAENWIKAGVFKSKEQAINHLLNVPIPGAKALKCKADGTIEYSMKDTWGANILN